ncbi:hypothetical protein GCM10017620_24530 [Brevundimonas intermedia]|uniref:Uncharacterized protein n=1 Tax=Brevundimonas intermedia TaxID=74315 RepID=A0ABQ5T9J7_9CAUL|nr:hypothetical protein [Brevundimonas intermedia]GLK49480.1 hypothetical protein GCM10017620_24530 [Brevundimonas intermedia]
MMIAFGVACMAVFAVNAWAAWDAKPRYTDAAGVAMMLCVSYGLTNLIIGVYGLPDAIHAFPVMDAIFVWMVWRAWMKNKRAWKMGVMSLLVAQLVLHAAFIFLWKTTGIDGGNLYAYIFLLNVAFTGQLIFAGSAGLTHAVVRAFDHMLGVRRQLAHARSR